MERYLAEYIGQSQYIAHDLKLVTGRIYKTILFDNEFNGYDNGIIYVWDGVSYRSCHFLEGLDSNWKLFSAQPAHV